MEIFLWMRNPIFKSFAFDSNIPEIASKLLDSNKVNFFYDQLLVKEPNTKEKTPWHHDLPYWPLTGKKIISFWVGFDAVNLNTGAVIKINLSKINKCFFTIRVNAKNFFKLIAAKMGFFSFG